VIGNYCAAPIGKVDCWSWLDSSTTVFPLTGWEWIQNSKNAWDGKDAAVRHANGSAMNFYGGQGEALHKGFVKAPGLKRRGECVSSQRKQRVNTIT
jgi:hypothetical protein